MKLEINTIKENERLSTQDLMSEIWQGIDEGCTEFEINACGQHNIGGSLWAKDKSDAQLVFHVKNPGQRLGAMGVYGTNIYVEGSAPADVGWLNSGADITVKGDCGDTTAHCAASGNIYVGGKAGTRSGALMKKDPKYKTPELWVLKSTGSFSFEFMGGGIAVVCGVDCKDSSSILGDRACTGMVGGIVYFRGPVKNISDDVFVLDLDDKDINFLKEGLERFLEKIERRELLETLLGFSQWRKIVAKTYDERQKTSDISLQTFRESKWMKEVGGSIFADLIDDDCVVADLVQCADSRLKIPRWKNYAYCAPCEYNCPIKIPTQKRFSLLREGKIKEALELVLEYSPFPASVCGQVCPNLCLNDCSRLKVDEPLDVKTLGVLSRDIKINPVKIKHDKKVAIIGSGVAGLSTAWQLSKEGYRVEIFEQDDKIGGKLSQVIPKERLSENILNAEIERFKNSGVKIHTNNKITKHNFEKIEKDFDATVLAIGAHGAVVIPFEGYERLIKGLNFLKSVKKGEKVKLGKKVVVIGAGNAAMDVVIEAYNQGAQEVSAIDIQKPSAFEKELEHAKNLGAKILWPCFTEKITKEGVILKDGTILEADSVIISIGDRAIFDFFDKGYLDEKSNVRTNEFFQTEFNCKVFAIGDAVHPGLFTNAIADGKNCAENVVRFLCGKELVKQKTKKLIPQGRIKSEYYSTERVKSGVYADSSQERQAKRLEVPFECQQPACDNEKNRCLSCGYCRDCGLCLQSCPNNAITRVESENCSFEYVSDDSKCIGCGICEGLCPCGIWEMKHNL